MSRVGRLPVSVPSGVTVTFEDGAARVRGPKGEQCVPIPESLEVAREGEALVVKRRSDDRQARSLHGLTRKCLWNAVTGVSEGFTRVLELNGVGYRAELKGDVIHFSLGYSHPILFQLPEGISAEIERQVVIRLRGSDRQLLGATAAEIRRLRPPEPYKGKGIKYAEETIRRKSGKAAGAA